MGSVLGLSMPEIDSRPHGLPWTPMPKDCLGNPGSTSLACGELEAFVAGTEFSSSTVSGLWMDESASL